MAASTFAYACLSAGVNAEPFVWATRTTCALFAFWKGDASSAALMDGALAGRNARLSFFTTLDSEGRKATEATVRMIQAATMGHLNLTTILPRCWKKFDTGSYLPEALWRLTILVDYVLVLVVREPGDYRIERGEHLGEGLLAYRGNRGVERLHCLP